jgi:GNAT superfamily N-acetyltransferase
VCRAPVQVLVMPTLQRHGYGRALVAAAYSLAKERDAIDLTVRGGG